jgi:DNA-binding GntR family transcriptional regulator
MLSLVSSALTEPAPASLSLAERAYLALRDRLITLDIRPGEPIDDLRIAGELEVGRTPVREALKRLEEDRLVVAYPRRGTFATGVDITDLAHINEIRVALEPLAAARAAQHITAEQTVVMRDLLGQLKAAHKSRGDRTDLMRLDLAVHRAMYRACGNPHLESVLIRYHNLATRIFCLFLDRLPDVAGHINEHVGLLTAIVNRNPDEAERLARAHVLGFETAVRAVI